MGELVFSMNDFYPNVLGGQFGVDTSTMVTPDKDDQQVLGESKESAEEANKANQPRTLNLFLAVGLIACLVVVFGMGGK